MNKPVSKFHEALKKSREEMFDPLTRSKIEEMLAEIYYRDYAEPQPQAFEPFTAPARSEGDVQAMIARPTSAYHKIIKGYMYTFYGAGTVHTGYGGARHLYELFYKQGMQEDMIESLIYVTLDDGKNYPLSALNVKKTHGTS